MGDTETRKEFFPIVGFEHYGVNRCGQIINFYTKKILKPRPVKGYVQYALYKVGYKKQFSRYGHRLVAEAFIPNPNSFTDINHKDEDGYNNWVYNLEWCTKQYNSEYSLAKVWKFINPSGDVVEVYNLSKFCRDNNLIQSAMHRLSTGKDKTHRGWTHYEEV